MLPATRAAAFGAPKPIFICQHIFNEISNRFRNFLFNLILCCVFLEAREMAMSNIVDGNGRFVTVIPDFQIADCGMSRRKSNRWLIAEADNEFIFSKFLFQYRYQLILCHM